MRRAVVIGAGFGGLAAAVRLAARGWSVTVCERNEQPGGRARMRAQAGHVFDRGPSVLTGRPMLEELWSLAGKKLDDDVELLRVDPHFRFVFPDGEALNLYGDAERMREEVRRVAPDELDAWDRYRGDVERFWDGTVREVMTQPMEHLTDLLRYTGGMLRFGGELSMEGLVRRYLREPRLVRALSFFPTFVGASPYAPGSAIYAAMQGLEWEGGVSFPRGGMHALVRALEALAKGLGVTFRYGSDVESITVERRRATGVRLRGDEVIESEVVVSNSDAAWTYLALLPTSARRVWGDARLKNARYSTGLFIWYFGARRRYDDVAHHTVLFGPEVASGWRPLQPDRFDTFTYLHRPTATDPALAPPGMDTFYALQVAPDLTEVRDWEAEAPIRRDAALRAVSRSLLPGVEGEITTEWSMTPRQFRDELLSVRGAAFSLSPALWQSAVFRPHAKSRDVKGLYLVGEGVHPGAGLPAVLSSAAIVDKLLT